MRISIQCIENVVLYQLTYTVNWQNSDCTSPWNIPVSEWRAGFILNVIDTIYNKKLLKIFLRVINLKSPSWCLKGGTAKEF